MGSLYLIRHGEPEFVDSRPRFIGRTDLSLSAGGIKGLHFTRAYLAGKDIGKVCASPLKRCVQSAEFIFAGRRIQLVDQLSEIDLGDWDGQPIEEIRSRFPEQYRQRGLDLEGFRPTDGESFADLSRRANRALDQILSDLEPDSAIAVVAHAGVNRTILCRATGEKLSNLFRFAQPYGCINELTFHRDGRLEFSGTVYK